jgi:hypothetical protein
MKKNVIKILIVSLLNLDPEVVFHTNDVTDLPGGAGAGALPEKNKIKAREFRNNFILIYLISI